MQSLFYIVLRLYIARMMRRLVRGIFTKTLLPALQLVRCRRGVAATELAIALPMLMLLMLGGAELSRYVSTHLKLEKISYTIADVTSQEDSATIAGLDQTLLAASTIMEPFEFPPNGVVFITSVARTGSGAATVMWQYSGGGTLEQESNIGNVGEVASLPGNFTLNASENVIISEVFYLYQPLISDSDNDII